MIVAPSRACACKWQAVPTEHDRVIVGIGDICHYSYWESYSLRSAGISPGLTLALQDEYPFFPLWVGYILLVNGLSEVMTGTSLLRRMRWSFLWLFVISIPMWWFFEYMNTIVQNWHYVFAHPISILHYEIQASIDFSTVVPAVLSISILVFQPFEDAHSTFE